MKNLQLLLASLIACGSAWAAPAAPINVAYKIVISDGDKVLRSYVVPSASDASHPAVMTETTEHLLVTDCPPGKSPTLVPLNVGATIELQPIERTTTGLLTAYSIVVTTLKEKKSTAVGADGCVVDQVKTSTTKLVGRTLVGAVPSFLSDDVDGQRIAISIAK